jgi:hypothetical protein
MSSGEVLRLAAVHGGVTVEAVHKMLCPELSVKTAERAIAEVRDHLRAIPFDGRRTLYVLNRRGRKAMGLPPRKGSEGERAIIFVVVTLGLFMTGGRKRFTVEQFEARLPDLVVKGIDSGRYLMEGGILSHLLIDYGAEARRLLKKVRRELARRTGSKWEAAIHNRAFYFTMITGTEPKARSLQRLFDRHDLPVHVVADPQLGHLLGVR